MSQVVVLMVIAGVILLVVLKANKGKTPKPTPTPDLPPNNPPVAHDPLLIDYAPLGLFLGDDIRLDLRHRVQGCDASGNATSETGAYDPEGDHLEYRVEAVGPVAAGVVAPLAVWNMAGFRIDGQWVRNGSEVGFGYAPAGPGKPLEVQALCRFTAGWSKSETPYPFKGCAPVPEPQPIIDKTKLGEVRFTYTVRDSKGLQVSRSIFWPCYDNCKQ